MNANLENFDAQGLVTAKMCCQTDRCPVNHQRIEIMKQDEEEEEEEEDGKADSKIRLQNVLLDDTQMRTLEEMPGPQLVKTRSIVLDTCRVDDGLLPRLATWVAPMEGLQSLSLPNNRVGDQGVGRLLQLLRELPG